MKKTILTAVITIVVMIGSLFAWFVIRDSFLRYRDSVAAIEKDGVVYHRFLRFREFNVKNMRFTLVWFVGKKWSGLKKVPVRGTVFCQVPKDDACIVDYSDSKVWKKPKEYFFKKYLSGTDETEVVR